MLNIYATTIIMPLILLSKPIFADLAETVISANELADTLRDAFDSANKIPEQSRSEAQVNYMNIYRESYEDLKGLVYQVQFEYSVSSQHDLVQLVQQVTREFDVWRVLEEARGMTRRSQGSKKKMVRTVGGDGIEKKREWTSFNTIWQALKNIGPIRKKLGIK